MSNNKKQEASHAGKVPPNGIKFNPKFKEFLENNPDISILKISWAFFWRLQLVLLPITFALMFLLDFLEQTSGAY